MRCPYHNSRAVYRENIRGWITLGGLPSMPKRVLIADDSEVVRRAVQPSVEERTGLEVCATTENGPQTIITALALRPDIVILDVLMPGMNGIEVASVLRSGWRTQKSFCLRCLLRPLELRSLKLPE
jgi:two-component system, NarL family, response regulator DesR